MLINNRRVKWISERHPHFSMGFATDRTSTIVYAQTTAAGPDDPSLPTSRIYRTFHRQRRLMRFREMQKKEGRGSGGRNTGACMSIDSTCVRLLLPGGGGGSERLGINEVCVVEFTWQRRAFVRGPTDKIRLAAHRASIISFLNSSRY